jgi:hypothetical protein
MLLYDGGASLLIEMWLDSDGSEKLKPLAPR